MRLSAHLTSRALLPPCETGAPRAYASWSRSHSFKRQRACSAKQEMERQKETRRLRVDDSHSRLGTPTNSPTRLPRRRPDWGETTTSSENSVLRRGRIQLPTFQPSAATEKGSFRLIPESLTPNLSHPPSLSTHTHSLSRTRTHILLHTLTHTLSSWLQVP